MINPPTFNTDFEKARDRAAYEQCQLEAFLLSQDEMRVKNGSVDPEDTPRRLRIDKEGVRSQHAKEKKDKENVIFYLLLEQMRQQLSELQETMDRLYSQLEDKYGQDNVIGGMAQTFLPAEVLAGLKTEEDKLNALAKEFLNPDGTIKEKYKHLDEAKYVQAWQQAQELQVTLDKYEHKQNLTREDKQEIYDAAKASSLSAKAGGIMEAANIEIKQAATHQVRDERADNEAEKQTSVVIFGRN